MRHPVAGLHRADAFRRAGVIEVAGIERVELRGELDQLRNVEDQEAGVAVLPLLVVDVQRERHVGGLGQLVGGDHPRPEHGVAVDRLAEAAVLLAARGHVEAERIAGDVVPGLLLRDVAALLADDDARARPRGRCGGRGSASGCPRTGRPARCWISGRCRPSRCPARTAPGPEWCRGTSASPRRAWRSWSAPPGSSAAWPPATAASPARSACRARTSPSVSSLSRHFGSAATTGSTLAV